MMAYNQDDGLRAAVEALLVAEGDPPSGRVTGEGRETSSSEIDVVLDCLRDAMAGRMQR